MALLVLSMLPRFGLAGACSAHEMCRPWRAPCLHVVRVLKAMLGVLAMLAPCMMCIARC